jgi:large subunit ribosomal protein L24
MKNEFSKNWKSSKQPRKQRKYLVNAPLHLKKNFVVANLSKDLRKKHDKRSLPIRKGDTVQVMRGKFKGNKGKVLNVKLKESKIIIENIQVTKMDGSKASVKLQPSNLQIIELNEEDKKRLKRKENLQDKETNKKQKEKNDTPKEK